MLTELVKANKKTGSGTGSFTGATGLLNAYQAVDGRIVSGYTEN